MATTIVIEGRDAANLIDHVARQYGSISRLTVTVGESDSEPGTGYLRIGINGGAQVPVYGRIGENHTDAVARLRELNAQYARGELTENPVLALREVMSLLDPAYEQLLHS